MCTGHEERTESMLDFQYVSAYSRRLSSLSASLAFATQDSFDWFPA